MRADGSVVKDETWGQGAWTAMPDEIVRDRALSLDAKGLIWFIATHSTNYVIRLEHLRLQVGVGEQKLLKILRELEQAGYIRREKTRQVVDGLNRQGPSRYVLSRSRQVVEPQTLDPQRPESQTPESQCTENQGAGETAGQAQHLDSQCTEPQTPEKSGTLSNYTKTKNKNPLPSGGVQGRGTRLPEDWAPSIEQVRWCRTEFPGLDGKAATEDFRDYWLGKAGAGARKVDWNRTWKRWIREAEARRLSRPGARRRTTTLVGSDGTMVER